jgi:hypothetical protein
MLVYGLLRSTEFFVQDFIVHFELPVFLKMVQIIVFHPVLAKIMQISNVQLNKLLETEKFESSG